MDIRKWLIVLMLLFGLGGCNNLEMSKAQKDYGEEKKLIDKYFDFKYSGDEQIEMKYYPQINASFIAKIVVPSNEVKSFLKYERKNKEIDYIDDCRFAYEMMCSVYELLEGDELDNFHKFVIINEENFDYAISRISGATLIIDGETTSLTREHHIIVLKEADGMVTIYAIADCTER